MIPMFGFAIVNPMGPTFMGFAIGKTKSGNASLLFFSLNPFTQTAEEIKTYNFDPHDVDQNSMLIEYGLCFDINEYLTIKNQMKMNLLLLLFCLEHLMERARGQ